MGRRHQAFLIARIRPYGTPPDHSGQRRCIAALHDHYGYEDIPLRAMKRLVDLVSQPENAVVVRAELRALDGKYGAHGGQPPLIPSVPCPYTAALFITAWSTDLEPGRPFYSTTCSTDLLEAQMGCWDGDNNDGISILDITNPEKPRYCFDTHESGLMDARGYLAGYYDLEELQDIVYSLRPGTVSKALRELWRRLLCSIRDLDTVPLINIGALREAWPSQATTVVSSGSFPHIYPSAANDSGAIVSVAEGVSTLANLTFDIAVKHQTEVDDDSMLENYLWLPGKAARAKSILRGVKELGPGGIRLLAVALAELKEVTSVDLSGFHLSASQIKDVLNGIADVEYLNLSDNPLLAADDIPSILDSIPTLRRLVLMDCPSIDSTRLLEVVRTQPSRFKSLEGILHPAFLETKKPDSYPSAFAYMTISDLDGPSCVSIPFFTPAQIVQALTFLLPWRNQLLTKGTVHSYTDCAAPVVGCAAFQAGMLRPGQTFSTRTVTNVPMFTKGIPPGENELWAFLISSPGILPSTTRDDPKPVTGWAFVRFVADEEDVDPTSGEQSIEDLPPTEPRGYSRRIYDLSGFLECMKDAGRPMPTPGAVKYLEDLLYLKNPKTDEFYCPLMTQSDLESFLRAP